MGLGRVVGWLWRKILLFFVLIGMFVFVRACIRFLV